jgi:hypothetical protein
VNWIWEVFNVLIVDAVIKHLFLSILNVRVFNI